MRHFYLFLISFVFFYLGNSISVQAQDEPIDTAAIYNMSLEELLQLKSTAISSELEALINSIIGVASKKPLNMRKSPSIISLVTREEIQRSGARDLIDVLNLIPGFDFGMDVQGVIGLGIRGNWAHEGKVLMLIDGQEQNEILYSNIAFGNHYSVDQIKKIEIIRGPGSAIYGGFAAYAVINIITRDGEDLNGVEVSGTYGQMQHIYGRRNLNISAGKKYKDFSYSLSGFLGQGNRSDRIYTSVYEDEFDMAGASRLDPMIFNLGLSFKDLSIRAIYDNYRTTAQDAGDGIFVRPYSNDFKSFFLELKYLYKVNDKLNFTPRFNYKKQIPWHQPEADPPDDEEWGTYTKSAERYRFNLTSSYDINYWINLTTGAEVFYDLAKTNDDSLFWDGNDETVIGYLNTAAFFQALMKSRIANLTVGARFDHNNAFGSAFVPRIGITKKLNEWNIKALYSHSFRAPSIENINSAFLGEIRPELSQIIELQAGYQLNKSMFITANFFDITTRNPIVYVSYDPVQEDEAYKNYPRTGTRGMEVEFKAKEKWGFINLNYTFYTPANKVQVPQYLIPGQRSALLGFSPHRANLNSSFNIAGNFYVSPSASFYGTRYAYTEVDEDDLPVLNTIEPMLMANLFLGYENLFSKGINIGIGCYNILNNEFMFIQPYNEPGVPGHAPLPGLSREFVIKLSWKVDFKKEKP